MTFGRMPMVLEGIISALLDYNEVSSYKLVGSRNGSATLVMRFAAIAADDQPASVPPCPVKQIHQTGPKSSFNQTAGDEGSQETFIKSSRHSEKQFVSVSTNAPSESDTSVAPSIASARVCRPADIDSTARLMSDTFSVNNGMSVSTLCVANQDRDTEILNTASAFSTTSDQSGNSSLLGEQQQMNTGTSTDFQLTPGSAQIDSTTQEEEEKPTHESPDHATDSEPNVGKIDTGTTFDWELFTTEQKYDFAKVLVSLPPDVRRNLCDSSRNRSVKRIAFSNKAFGSEVSAVIAKMDDVFFVSSHRAEKVRFYHIQSTGPRCKELDWIMEHFMDMTEFDLTRYTTPNLIERMVSQYMTLAKNVCNF